MRVAMLGSGYVGLVSGACFAEFGAQVTCMDTDAEKIKTLRAGKIPIYEPGLAELVAKNIAEGRLRFSERDAEAIGQSDVVFLAVGTPARRGDGDADLRYIHQAAREIAEHLQGYTVIVDKSTVPPGTAREVQRIIADANPAADFDIASNPEFLREGAAIADFMRPDRVVIGVENERAKKTLQALYRPLNLIEAPMLITDLESAELIKYAANAFLATKISFINEISTLCEAVGADVHAVAKGMGMDGRIGAKFLHPGPGYGGSCFPKDTRALVSFAKKHDASSRIVEAVIDVNEAQKARMIEKIHKASGGDVAGKTFAILGLTFKPETDDMRDAPALSILPALLDSGATLQAHDPQGMDEARKLLRGAIRFCDDAYQACAGADAIVLLTEWNAYRNLSLDRLKAQMSGNVFIDLRNVYEPDLMREAGFDYHCIGR